MHGSLMPNLVLDGNLRQWLLLNPRCYNERKNDSAIKDAKTTRTYHIEISSYKMSYHTRKVGRAKIWEMVFRRN